MTVDLSNYTEKIHSEEDRPLFGEAAKAARSGALRAAYIMLWLSCAESLKRRFKEAGRSDENAEKIFEGIRTKEGQNRSVDTLLLDKARDYGFISSSDHTTLAQVYQQRCIYTHPYEQAPLPEQVSCAAAIIIASVLSHPTKLQSGYADRLISNFIDNRAFLDDQESAVSGFIQRELSRINETIYSEMLCKYWQKLEEIADNPSLGIFFRRGVWVTRTMLTEVGAAIFSDEEWHNNVHSFPKTLVRACNTSIFQNIGEHAQDSILGLGLEMSSQQASILSRFEKLYDSGVFNHRQRERLDMHIIQMELGDLRASRLSTAICFTRLIKELKVQSWRIQNLAMRLIIENGAGNAGKLGKRKWLELGRNILQAGEGDALAAHDFLDGLAQNIRETRGQAGASWLFNITLGASLESFTNEKDQLRFKDNCLGSVLSAIDSLSEKKRQELIATLKSAIDRSTPLASAESNDFTEVITSLNAYPWAASLMESLYSKAGAPQPPSTEWEDFL